MRRARTPSCSLSGEVVENARTWGPRLSSPVPRHGPAWLRPPPEPGGRLPPDSSWYRLRAVERGRLVERDEDDLPTPRPGFLAVEEAGRDATATYFEDGSK